MLRGQAVAYEGTGTKYDCENTVAESGEEGEGGGGGGRRWHEVH